MPNDSRLKDLQTIRNLLHEDLSESDGDDVNSGDDSNYSDHVSEDLDEEEDETLLDDSTRIPRIRDRVDIDTPVPPTRLQRCADVLAACIDSETRANDNRSESHQRLPTDDVYEFSEEATETSTHSSTSANNIIDNNIFSAATSVDVEPESARPSRPTSFASTNIARASRTARNPNVGLASSNNNRSARTDVVSISSARNTRNSRNTPRTRATRSTPRTTLQSGTSNSIPLSPAPAPSAPLQRPNSYVAKDGTVWDKTPPTAGRARLHNVRRDNGPRTNIPDTTAITNFQDAILLFIQPILHIIVEYTNLKAARVHEEKNYKTEWKDCNEVEVLAFIGIIIMAGVMKQSKTSVLELWDTVLGTNFYRAVMSLHRFKQLLRYMRFDDTETRDRGDKFAPIRQVWETVNNLLGKYYTPSDFITIDEQLLAYRGHSKFRQYMPSKPAKYGIKFWWACDANSYYPLNGKPYLGKEGNERAVGLGSEVVKSLSEPYYGTGRNITCDNFFTTDSLARELLRNKLTLVGTLKKNKAFLPEEFKPQKRRAIGSSVFGFQYDLTITSYVPKAGKSVALLSTMHHDNFVDEESGKPDIILDYNATKGGVDTFDQMVQTYTCKRGTRRWPMAVFYNLIDVAGVAAYVIWTKTYPDWNKNRTSRRRIYLREVVFGLVRQQVQTRYQNCHHKSVITAMERVLPQDNENGEQDAENETRKRGRCHVCRRAKDRKSKQRCDTCNKPICKEHSKAKRVCRVCEEL